MRKIKCTECGKELSFKARVCPHCGTSTKYKMRIFIPIISILACIIFIVVLFLIFFAFKKQLYTDVLYSYDTSNDNLAYDYYYYFFDDNTYSYTIIESDLNAMEEKIKELNGKEDNYDFMNKIFDEYSKTTYIKGTYKKENNKIYLREDDTSKNYECDIISYDKIKCNNMIFSFDRKEEVKKREFFKKLEAKNRKE